MFSFDKDIRIDDIRLWLDSRRKRDAGFISHAHADHFANHKRIICTPATGRFLEKRLRNPRYESLPYHHRLEMDDYTLETYPAGHILGSAQIKISNSSMSLLYTGDFKLEPSRTVEPFEYAKADIVIMETTFGKPHYRTPPRQEVEDQLITTCTDLLRQNRVPVVFAYSLGKGQEALKILSGAGLRVAVDYSILKFVPIYQAFGVTFPVFEKFKKSEFRDRVLLLPPSFRHHRYIKSLPGVYSIFLSGWGLDERSRSRFGVDRVIPLSDHADFSQLMQFVENVKPECIYCTHGMKTFIDILNAAGFRAFELLNNTGTCV